MRTLSAASARIDLVRKSITEKSRGRSESVDLGYAIVSHMHDRHAERRQWRALNVEPTVALRAD